MQIDPFLCLVAVVQLPNVCLTHVSHTLIDDFFTYCVPYF